MIRVIVPSVVLASAVACSGGGGDAAIIVDPPAPTVASVTVVPGSVSLDPGATRKLTANARDASGASISGTTFTWTTSAPSIASVSIDGTVTALAGGSATIYATAAGKTGSATITIDHVYDLAALGAPAIITADYIELAKIARISRFRSGIGHDYSDDAERCRSMKHYFQPRGDVDWSNVVVSSPVAGTIVSMQNETTFGQQVKITSAIQPAVTVILFHVRPDAGVGVGSAVTPGQRLGTHIGTQTMSDVAIKARTPTGTRNISYFDAMTDAVFQSYVTRGIASRSATAIGAAERDASPLVCDGEQFQGAGTLANWVEVR